MEVNVIYNKSCERMEEVDDNSVHLIVTSPPYNVGKEYDKGFSLEEYLNFLKMIWAECKRVLIEGGRLCVNIAGVFRQPYIPLQSYINIQLIELGFLSRGDIIWYKGAKTRNDTAWGSWCSYTNPILRDEHEYILVFSKNSFKREKTGESTIIREEFLKYTKSVWHFPPESSQRIGHPAPFPVELPYRLIQLYSGEGDIVLDPFIGSGTTAIACIKTGRKYIGYETEQKYIKICKKRLQKIGKLFYNNK